MKQDATLKCSIIICTHNRADRLKFCLEAVSALDYDAAEYEVLVIDNVSTDETRSIVEAQLPQLVNGRYIYEPELGLSAARNRGIRESQGRILAFTDDDCIPERQWLAAIMAAFERFPKAGLVVGRIQPKWEAPQPEWLDMNTVGLFLSCIDYSDSMCLMPKERVVGGNTSLRREAVLKAGFFRTDLGFKGRQLIGNDEIEYAERVSKHGYAVAYTPFAVVRHFIPKNRITQEYFLNRWYGQGRADYRMASGEWQIDHPASAPVSVVRSLRSVGGLYLARKQVRKLRQRTPLPMTSQAFTEICQLNLQAGYCHERMRQRFAHAARLLLGKSERNGIQ